MMGLGGSRRMPTSKCCGNCELLERSTTPGLATYGKCPHRDGWVRTGDEPCEWHEGEPGGPFVQIAMALNLAAASIGAGTAIWLDVHFGNGFTHVLLGVAGLTVVAFAWYVRGRGLFAEEAKYQILERQELPPEEKRQPPAF